MADYLATDASTHDGKPIHLVRFDYQTTIYRYTTSDVDFFDGINTWDAYEISVPKDLAVSDNLERASVDLITRTDNPVAQLFRTNAVEATVSCSIYEVHRDDGEIVLIHSGRILARHVSFKGKKKEAKLKSEPLITAQKRPAIREKTSRTCPYVLYDSDTCKASKIGVPGTVASISGISLVITGADAEADGQFTGGYLETSEEKRMIVSHTGTSIGVTTAMQGLEVGDAVTMYIGCEHTTQDCIDKHDNILNFGGEPFIPEKNPHEGRLV